MKASLKMAKSKVQEDFMFREEHIIWSVISLIISQKWNLMFYFSRMLEKKKKKNYLKNNSYNKIKVKSQKSKKIQKKLPMKKKKKKRVNQKLPMKLARKITLLKYSYWSCIKDLPMLTQTPHLLKKRKKHLLKAKLQQSKFKKNLRSVWLLLSLYLW